ncbi:probable glutamate carboxypeptidase LAMP1 [Impatiens glandulifera]|uniref:probable glutamate carboxypeptidase LAMP1 n=1 Tax=Impatiens glandulifera TaxID=253017 RepID=UPI001FB0D946|nr:probable glutamate carboxypeptidase LAMP1 [Impatiens glandulifera]
MMNKTVITIIFISIFIFIAESSSSKSFYHTKFLSLSDNTSIANHLFILTRRPHVAGTLANAETASYVQSTLISNQIPSHFASYEVSLTYPVSRSLNLTDPSSSSIKQFSLRQEIYKGDPYANVANEILPTFHAYAKSGSVSGSAVYANYGRVEDFATLKQIGVNVSGNIVLARYGQIFRGDIVQNAQEAGAIGVVIYTDKKDYGGGGGGGDGGDKRWFPDGKWMPPSGVQVGSVFKGSGDPTTTGWASVEGCERLTEEEVMKTGDVPLIPSLPVSWKDGEIILNSIDGPVVNGDWQGGEDASVYKVGPGPGILNLHYQGKEEIRTIHNVIGIIEGSEEPDRYVILGNHRDAWTFGAVDPNSGTAALLELTERLGKLQKQGWRPRRTIVFCSWDAEEYGLIGSTEWVEENRETLISRAVAYLNVDVAVYGKGFHASSTPQLDELILQASQLVPDPDNSSQTVYDAWLQSKSKAVLGRLGGGGSDYKAFVQHIGVPSVDMITGDGGYPVYHSMYDDFVWMKKFGDPMFKRHVAVASVWGLVALRLADEEILPFNYLHYADELQKSAEDLKVELSGKDINLKPLLNSIDGLRLASIKINDQKEAYLKRNKRKDSFKARELNDRLMMAERAFTDSDGLPSRPWSKHLIYAPSKHNGYGSKSFPGIHDAIEMAKQMNTKELWKSVQHEVWRVSRAIKHASLVLNGKLT